MLVDTSDKLPKKQNASMVTEARREFTEEFKREVVKPAREQFCPPLQECGRGQANAAYPLPTLTRAAGGSANPCTGPICTMDKADYLTVLASSPRFPWTTCMVTA